MTLQETCELLEALAEQRRAMEERFDPLLRPIDWYDDPEYAALCLAIVNAKASLGRHCFGKLAGRKGGKKEKTK